MTTTQINLRLRKILSIAGLALILVGCVANLYSLYTNRRFLHDPLDYIYYLRYIILLAGGFAAEYFLTRNKTKDKQLFVGIVYGIMAITVFGLLDIIRVGIQNTLGAPSYPMGKLLFMGMPLVSLVFIIVTAYMSQRQLKKNEDIGVFTKKVLLFSFIIYQLYIVSESTMTLLTNSATEQDVLGWFFTAVISLLGPISVAIVAYALLGSVKKQLDRAFYGVLIGAFYSTATIVLWEFRTDASYEATNIFGYSVIGVAALFITIILWRMRNATKK